MWTPEMVAHCMVSCGVRRTKIGLRLRLALQTVTCGACAPHSNGLILFGQTPMFQDETQVDAVAIEGIHIPAHAVTSGRVDG